MDSSSKVTVEYHDPSGVFPLLSRDISSRLPLRNLNWQTPSRPLRQIKSLHLDFVPDQATKDALRPPSQRSSGGNPNGPRSSVEILHTGAEAKKLAVKERRHQIPGLQTSPYLKIYLLRCDDKDTYKATERKKVRDWISEEAAAVTAKAKGKGKGENHDAFEWLIVHVVVPDTVAATESRWRVSQKDTDELKERKQGTKWPGKSTRTVFDKLRADFNETGKSAQDRVAQIRLVKGDIPPDLLPTHLAVATFEETAEEREKAWNDLMTKVKNLILDPFDRRVRQYEADITEQESRRSLPGFNFCTFFIHKEGLAKALESIGLVEDALVIYDELSVGLEAVLQDMTDGRAEGTATTFADYSDDIVERITASTKSMANGTDDPNHAHHEAADLFGKDYRHKIVTSSISIFDFVSYLFTRQKSLILRLANAKVARTVLGSPSKDGGEDLVLTSEVCWRASSFIHIGARRLRQDLRARKQLSKSWDASAQDIESLVCSWTYVVADQVLNETSVQVLDQSQDARRESVSQGSVTSPRRSDFSFAGLGANPYPQRTTSLALRKARVAELQNKGSIKSASDSDVTSPPSSSGTDGTFSGHASIGGLPGVPELATYRAELVMIKRRMLEHVARQMGWATGWSSLHANSAASFTEVELDDSSEHDDVSLVTGSKTTEPSKLVSPVLASAITDETAFHATYERLSDLAMRYYLVATHAKSAESIVGDIAILKSQQGDYAYAANCFQHVLPLYTNEGWDVMEAEALRTYAQCLKALERKEEYVETQLSLLARICGREKARKRRHTRLPALDDQDIDSRGLLPDLIKFSESLSRPLASQADQYFTSIFLDQIVTRQHQHHQDGFSLRVHLQHLLPDQCELDDVRVRLIHMDDHSHEVWLTTSGPIMLVQGDIEFDVHASTAVFGPHLLDRIELRAKNLLFTKDFHPDEPAQQSVLGPKLSEHLPIPPDRHRQPWVFLYPARHSFDASVSMRKHIEVGKPRFVTVQFESGWNTIQSIELRLKSASAGLRLHLGDAVLEEIEQLAEGSASPGHLHLGSLAEYRTAYVHIPYSLEQSPAEICIRLEVQYSTAQGRFTFANTARLKTPLALDVSVDDTFHLDTLFSSFSVKTIGPVPLIITDTSVQDSIVYSIEAPPVLPMPISVVEQRPANLLYKVSRKELDFKPVSKTDAALSLSIDYWPINELVDIALRRTLLEVLDRSDFAHLGRLLAPLLSRRAKELYSNTEYENAALLSFVRVPTYDEVGWHEVIATLATDVRAPLATWLHSFHGEHEQVLLHQPALLNSRPHRITIPVDIPTIDIVYRVTLSLLKDHRPQQSSLPLLSLGQPVSAQLRLEHSRAWSHEAIFSNVDGKNLPSPQRFHYDIHADADTWLIGGPRRAQFSPDHDGSSQTLEVTLLPLRVGILPLPLVDVQPLPTAGGENHTQGSVESCETQCASTAAVVQVVREGRTTRVEVPDGAEAG